MRAIKASAVVAVVLAVWVFLVVEFLMAARL
jgi:hypothetical protein